MVAIKDSFTFDDVSLVPQHPQLLLNYTFLHKSTVLLVSIYSQCSSWACINKFY